jgi:hypothetical protein
VLAADSCRNKGKGLLSATQTDMRASRYTAVIDGERCRRPIGRLARYKKVVVWTHRSELNYAVCTFPVV